MTASNIRSLFAFIAASLAWLVIFYAVAVWLGMFR